MGVFPFRLQYRTGLVLAPGNSLELVDNAFDIVRVGKYQHYLPVALMKGKEILAWLTCVQWLQGFDLSGFSRSKVRGIIEVKPLL